MPILWLVAALLGPPAIHWTGNSVSDADALARLGVRHVVTEQLLAPEVLDTLASFGIRVTSHSGVRYPTLAAYVADSLGWKERLLDPYHYYQGYAWYAGHVAMENPSPWLRYEGPGMVWRRVGEVTVDGTGGWMAHHDFDAYRFQEHLADTTVIHVIPDSWLQGESGPLVRVWLRDPGVRISVPRPDPPLPPARWDVWTLLATILIWTAGFSMMPTYRKSQSRYWITHTFFVADVAQRRIRLGGAALLLWITSALLTGTFLLTAADILLTDGGRDAALALGIPAHPASLFLIGTLGSLIWDGVLILWLHVAGARAPVLYLWPRHLHAGIVLILVAIAGGSPLQPTAPFWLTAFPVIWMAAFPIAVRDFAAAFGNRKARFLAWTALPYLMLMLAAAWALLMSPLPETAALLLAVG